MLMKHIDAQPSTDAAQMILELLLDYIDDKVLDGFFEDYFTSDKGKEGEDLGGEAL